MKMSKILSLILAGLMTLACFAGCNQPTVNPDNPDTPGTPDAPVQNELAGTYDTHMVMSYVPASSF